MINDLDVNLCPIQPFELYTNHQLYSEQQLECDNRSRKIRVSSQYLFLKKKIRHNKSRPSILRIEEGVRNVKLYNVVTSQTNLDNMNQQSQSLVKFN
ncbi:unnamed protein product [Paramecium sonneborni]|uniref:Uncharacterized protein n=1 Tax=Paramecium sonneborni TaxID=65129 RepID=A0A8S1K900_9CILI|nr:unnamed protein product [Paramecium sonneborni]